jgi:DNA-binding beta-propeller fold protein YncE
VFYELPQPIDLATSDEMGFSTALGVLSNGLVVLGNVASVGGTGVCNAFDSSNVGSGHLTVIGADGVKRTGGNVTSLDGGVDGPWDLTIVPESATKAIIFVANLNVAGGIDHGQVLRKDLTLTVDGGISSVTTTVIAAGYKTRCDSAAFVVGPTGLAYDSSTQKLYVASTGDNAIFEIDSANTAGASNSPGNIVAKDLKQFHGPLGLVLAQNGDLISTQGDAVSPDKTHPSEIVEITGGGTFLSQFSIATTRSFPGKGAGAAFGIALEEGSTAGSSRFAAVDDGSNVLDVWSF